MSDTPTFASLLTQWTSGGPAGRASVYVHLKNHPAEAAAVEASIRDELNSEHPWKRVIAAEAIAEVYRDENAAAAALAGVFRQGDPAACADAVPVLHKLSAPLTGPLLADFALHAPAVFKSLPPNELHWMGGKAAMAGPAVWLNLFAHAGAEVESHLLRGLCVTARYVKDDFSPVEDAVRQRLFHEAAGYAAGGALWRLTWRVNRDWLASINPDSPRLADKPLLTFLIQILTEHLGRRPDLAPVVRALLVRQSNEDSEQFPKALKRLANLGGRGWAVLLPILGDVAVAAATRASVFNEAATRLAVLPLAHHHAHAVVLAQTANLNVVSPELLRSAANTLRAIGAPAGFALPDILELVVRLPHVARHVTHAIPALATGFPIPAAAIARTLDRLRRSNYFSLDAFTALAEVFAAMNLDGGPGLIEDTSFDSRTADTLLQQPAWKDAPQEIRRKHALVIADQLASSRPDVRSRAADLIRHYSDQMHVVWPALVALLAGNDEKAVLLVLPHFRHLAPVADEVTAELTTLFREPNPAYAARAVVALWRLGRMPVIADDLRAAVVTAADDAWGWAVLRGVVDRVFQAHGLLHELSEVFAAAPAEVATKIQALLNPPEAAEEAAISAHVPLHSDLSAAAPPSTVNWNGVFQCVGSDIEGGFLFLALMCAHGSGGFASQKIWMIKHQRMTARTGLGEAKTIVERAIECLTASATAGEKRACVRDYFTDSPTELPKLLTHLLEHRLSWYRWAGLELLDAWDAPARVPALIEDRIWDRSVLVRMRALRMHHGQ
jgi:hypothetical protein